MLNKRFHLLLDKDLWKKISKSSKDQNISVGELIRRAIKEELERKKELINQKQPIRFKGFFKPGSK